VGNQVVDIDYHTHNNAAPADEFEVRGFGKLVASPLSRRSVRARQARLVLSKGAQVGCFCKHPKQSAASSSFCGLLFLSLSQAKRGAASFFTNFWLLTGAGLALFKVLQVVRSAEIFLAGGHFSIIPKNDGAAHHL